MQMMMFNPRQTPTATAAMLACAPLRSAIESMRQRARVERTEWPYVESVGGTAWAVDDSGIRSILVGYMVYELDDFEILSPTFNAAARAVFERLEAGAAA